MKLEKGKKAATPKGMSHNVKTMEKAGYSKKRAEGTAYGEVGMEKKARKDESKGILNQLKNKEVKQAYKETEEYKRKKGISKDQYVVPMTNKARKDWESAVRDAKQIASGKKIPPYLK